MSVTSIVKRSGMFILELRKQSDCSQNSDFKVKGRSLYEELVQWFPKNKTSDDYDEAVCIVFSLLQELYQKNGLSGLICKDLSNHAVTVIKSSQSGKIDPHLNDFLNQQLYF